MKVSIDDSPRVEWLSLKANGNPPLSAGLNPAPTTTHECAGPNDDWTVTIESGHAARALTDAYIPLAAHRNEARWRSRFTLLGASAVPWGL